MTVLSNKIDFAVIVNVRKANPNGDPLTGNRPRVSYDGYGEISDVCIKRKIRNRLMHAGYPIFVQSDDNRMEGDEYRSLLARAKGELKDMDVKKDKDYRQAACQKWIDVRAFGQVFAFPGSKKGKRKKEKGEVDQNAEPVEDTKDEKGVSIGIRGPVSIHPAISVTRLDPSFQQITKSVNLDKDGPERAPDTMGMKHRVDHGVYVFYGAMNPQLANEKTGTGFKDEDAEAIKEALRTLFKNDESSARPAGSMEVHKVYWWKHNSNNGQYSSAKVHRLLEVKPNKAEPRNIGDYDITLKELPGLKCEVIDGE